MIFLSVSSRTSLPVMHMGGHHILGDQQESVTADGIDEVGHTIKWKAEMETGWKGIAVVDMGRFKQFKEICRFRLTLAGCYQQIICLIWWKEPYLVTSNSTRNRRLIWTCLLKQEHLLYPYIFPGEGSQFQTKEFLMCTVDQNGQVFWLLIMILIMSHFDLLAYRQNLILVKRRKTDVSSCALQSLMGFVTVFNIFRPFHQKGF